MNITIGNTTIAITSCTRMRDLKRGFYLDIKIPKDSISMDELSALLDGNTETIYVIDGENESAYNGFKMLSTLSLEDGVYQVCQACTSEIEAQLSIAQNKVAEQAKELEATKQVVNQQAEIITAQGEVISNQGAVIESQGETIATQQKAIEDQVTALAEQAATIAEQGETITAQTEQVMVLEEASVMQMSTIDSLLLEVIPAVITDAVTVAVAEALASTSTTDEKSIEEEPVVE